MELIIADKDGIEIAEMSAYQFDSDQNGEKTFEVTIPANLWRSYMTYGARVYVPDTEIGGIVGQIYTDTQNNTVSLMGRTWRGVLNSKIIQPPSGSNYYTIAGPVGSCLARLTAGRFGNLIQINAPATYVPTFQFERYCTLLSGIDKMLASIGGKLTLAYRQGEPNESGYLEVGASPIVDYSDEIELSQDSRLNFTFHNIKDGVNHLIVGGQGELESRNILHLYVQANGSIGTTQYYTGLDEIEYFYENTSTETAELEETAKDFLKDIMNRSEFVMNVEALDLDVSIGDIIGGRDYITGMYTKKPVANIILTIEDGRISKQFEVEGAQ